MWIEHTFDTVTHVERVGELITTIRAAADELSSLDLTALAPQQLGELVQQIEHTRCLVDAASNAALDRFDADGAAAYDGLRSTTSWLRQRCQMTGASAARRVRTARALRHLPIVAEGFRTGRFSADQADLFARNRNPRTAEAMTVDEAALAALADHLRPDDFARELRGWAEMVDTDGTEPDAGHRDRSFNFVQTLDDTWTGRLDLSAADGLFVHHAIDAMAEALYRTHEAGDHPTAVDGDALRADDSLGPTSGATAGGTRSTPSTNDDRAVRTPTQRRADALVELIRRGTGRSPQANQPADTTQPGTDTPDTGDSPAGTPGTGDSPVGSGPPTIPRVTLYLTLDAGDLEAGRGADALDGHHLGAHATNRLLCDAAITRVLTDPTTGAVLNFGRDRRVVTPAQRAALAIRDSGCSFPGCTAPPQDCEAHHIIYWRDGGPTDIDNLTLACWATHHPLAHEGGWHIIATPGGRPTWLRPDHTPLQQEPGWHAPPESAQRPRLASRPPGVQIHPHQRGRPRHSRANKNDTDESDTDELVRIARERARELQHAA